MQETTRRDFLTGAAALGLLAGGASSATRRGQALRRHRPWNFILILIDDMGWRDLGCYGSPTYLIPNIDRLARKLEQLQIADRTVIRFTSDNGGLIYEGSSKDAVTDKAPVRAGKGHLYERGIRVPLIVRWPGVTRSASVMPEANPGYDLARVDQGLTGTEKPTAPP